MRVLVSGGLNHALMLLDTGEVLSVGSSSNGQVSAHWAERRRRGGEDLLLLPVMGCDADDEL